MTEAGLRERKKQRTRDALISAALTLFQRKGFEATTVEEIANAVEVSPRTFFRYFTSKEDVALTLQFDLVDAMLAAYAKQPADQPVLTALRDAIVGVVRASEEGESGFDPSRFACTQQLLADSTALSARSMEYGTARLDDLAGLVATRMGVDRDADPRPYLVASVTVCAVQTAVGAWQAKRPGARVSDLVDQAFTLLAAGLNYPAADA
ncbi:TetR family transcriptional regulator [Solihabitans fulvus]|uniref:TetR family transcriptional regulator n=1 Tax=Solihabitans fulvus TaxID=1892852 RepID=A0A5B2WDH8_9PSEU|nr:TetR family transcriptional regulator [Solihabitans fulvus]KAA2250123.1 TetR family transcriptional regulator [Solihabitans fulvus]